MITNYFRIDLPFETFQIQRLPYTESCWLELKDAHNHEASFFRYGDNLFISPSQGVDLELGELVTLSVAGNVPVVSSLIRHLIFRNFRDAFRNRIPLGFSPLAFVSERVEHDIVRKLLPPDLQGVLRFPSVVEVETRSVTEDGLPSFGLLIRRRQRWLFDKNLAEILNEGFDVLGRGVLESQPIPGLEGILAPEDRLLGEVDSTEGSDALVRTNKGLVRRPLDALVLQRSQSQIGDYLAHRLGENEAQTIFQQLKNHRQNESQPDRDFTEIVKFAKWFSKDKGQDRVYRNGDGFCFTVTNKCKFSRSSFRLNKTKLIFDYTPGASATTPLYGLVNHGPFNSERFANNNMRLLALCEASSRGAMSQFAERLREGIPESRHFSSGLKGLFRLNSVEVVIKEVSSFHPEAFEAAIDQIIQESDDNRFDLALVECSVDYRSVRPADNPYYRARARLMSYGIPTQGVKKQHLRSSSDKLQWTLGPMALQIYAKIGGTPWRLPASQSIDREIVIGVGSSLERQNSWAGAEQSRVVGITTFFLGDGNYVLGERLRSVPYEEYFETLLSSLKSSIETVANEFAWKKGDSVRIVFHIFKPIKNIEADVVARLVESLPDYKILFAFVTISTQHPWMMFRHLRKRGRALEVELSERGENVVLDQNQCLLQIRGHKDRPNRFHRPPFPVLLKIHEKSTFKDLQYIAQQVQDFSFLSWRSFFPSETPVTAFYSSLISSEITKLSKIPGWQNGFIDSHFRRKLWFL